MTSRGTTILNRHCITAETVMIGKALSSLVGLMILRAACAFGQPSQPGADDGSLMHDVPESVTLFQDVRVFDGKADALSAPSYVLVRGNRIEQISATPI